jgi:hypothetical protein
MEVNMPAVDCKITMYDTDTFIVRFYLPTGNLMDSLEAKEIEVDSLTLSYLLAKETMEVI